MMSSSLSLLFITPILLIFSLYAPFSSATLAPQPSPALTYHGGPLLCKQPVLDVYIIWYGSFSRFQRRIMVDFLSSIAASRQKGTAGAPTVSSWWSTMTLYKDRTGTPVSSGVKLAGQISDKRYSAGKLLKATDIENLAKVAMSKFASDPSALYIVLTSQNVLVEGFCESQCGTHATVKSSAGGSISYAWVGNSATQCPGQCAWPFALPVYMTNPVTEPAKLAPNDIGMDGMVMNVATILAGASSNPVGNAYYQGDPQVPLEAGTICAGIFGQGAYPGNPGNLLTDKRTGASFNAVGIRHRRFLLPALWHPELGDCKTLT